MGNGTRWVMSVFLFLVLLGLVGGVDMSATKEPSLLRLAGMIFTTVALRIVIPRVSGGYSRPWYGQDLRNMDFAHSQSKFSRRR